MNVNISIKDIWRQDCFIASSKIQRERERSNFTQARFVSEDQNLQLENDLESVLLNITNQLYKNVEI